ncbi:MAG: bacillithiol biosynthesis deacetylase BshB1 [Acidobacteriota bacterium]
MQIDFIAFGAHPDDVELFAGGTMAKMAALGYSTAIVDMTRGELGTRGSVALRRKESLKAAKILGLKERHALGFPDGNVRVTAGALLKVIRVLRKYRPKVVLTHHWDDFHPDHLHTSRLVTEAAHHSGLAKIDTGQERFRPRALLYFKVPLHTTPGLVVDVTDYSAQRRDAILAYGSQLFDPSSSEPETKLSHPDFLARIESIHRFYGSLIGKKVGEAFCINGVLEVKDLLQQFT